MNLESVRRPSPINQSLPDLDELIVLVKKTTLEQYSGAHDNLERVTKEDGSWVTAVDRQMQAQLCAKLGRRWPRYGFIGEEMPYDEQAAVCQQKSSSGYWVLDPLDGTTNFASGFPFYGVSLALVVAGEAQIGVVFDPLRDECFAAQRGNGAYLNQQRLVGSTRSGGSQPKQLSECIAIIDYKRLVSDLAAQLVRVPPYRSQRNLGCSVLEWCWLAAGRAQLYLHGGQKLWDFAAGHLILSEAGGSAKSLSGQALNCASLRNRSVVAASNPALSELWQHWLSANRAVPKSSPW